MPTDRAFMTGPARSPLIPLTALLLRIAGMLCTILAASMPASASAALAIFGSTLFLAAGGFVGGAALMHTRARFALSQPLRRVFPSRAESWSITD